MKLALAFMAGRIEQLRSLIKNRERDTDELTKRLGFIREQIGSANDEIGSLQKAIAAIGPAEDRESGT